MNEMKREIYNKLSVIDNQRETEHLDRINQIKQIRQEIWPVPPVAFASESPNPFWPINDLGQPLTRPTIENRLRNAEEKFKLFRSETRIPVKAEPEDNSREDSEEIDVVKIY